jgi:hypothetical protein
MRDRTASGIAMLITDNRKKRDDFEREFWHPILAYIEEIVIRTTLAQIYLDRKRKERRMYHWGF